MAKKSFFVGMLAVLVFGLVLAGCSKKDGGGSSSGASGGADVKVAASGGKAAPASDFTYDLSEDGKGVVIKKYTGNGGKLVIPAEIEGLPVVALGEKAFYGEDNTSYGPGQNITSVVIPASVKLIDLSCFNKIEKLTSVTILGSGVEIGFAFRNCINLSELKFPDGENVLVPGGLYGPAKSAFIGCKKLPLAVRSKLNAMGFTDI
jgi:hypothetical protein